MKLSQIKQLIDFCKNDLLFDTEEFKEVVNNFKEEEEDFEVSNYRFIHSDSIDQIQRDELKNDLWLIGNFNANFLAECSELPQELIEEGQKGEQYEAVGKAMLPYIDEIQEEYARLDGYGHHFSFYDGETLEILNYFVFRTN